MTHTITWRSNPRLLLFYFLLAALPLGGLAFYPHLSQVMGGIVLAASFFIDYRLFRFARPYLKTKIVTGETDAVIHLPNQEEIFPWTEITLSGKCLLERGRPFIFLYHRGKDRVITIPYEYTDMPGLEKTLSEKTPYEVFQLSSAMDLRQILHDRYASDKT
ncbi:MAG: hypothetical protein LBT33_05455 [Spirochaetia bacterium]|jgi:hypothetical protein|nr:hypothetical protein [Spirochaetia bacterium]